MSHAADSQESTPISITICGDGGCGKSSITLRLVRSQWTSEYDPTIEDSYSITRRVDGASYHLALTDTAGQEEYRGMWASTNLGADAFLLVYDITSSGSLESLSYFNDLIDMESETRLDNATRAQKAGLRPGAGADEGEFGSRTIPPVKIIAGNKCDLQESRQISASQGLDWARKRGCGFMETSARLEVNIEETFALIIRRVVEARRRAAAGVVGNPEMNQRGATRPLTPIGSDRDADNEKRDPNARGPRNGPSDHTGKSKLKFLKSLKCW
ncbi:hypothetical protein E8E14_004044 [Neopestalotiopsis sp. 37M]|nr:hypothetical protein E8E14_004044 [Neopestalotiopsis sp. 37M]